MLSSTTEPCPHPPLGTFVSGATIGPSRPRYSFPLVPFDGSRRGTGTPRNFVGSSSHAIYHRKMVAAGGFGRSADYIFPTGTAALRNVSVIVRRGELSDGINQTAKGHVYPPTGPGLPSLSVWGTVVSFYLL